MSTRATTGGSNDKPSRLFRWGWLLPLVVVPALLVYLSTWAHHHGWYATGTCLLVGGAVSFGIGLAWLGWLIARRSPLVGWVLLLALLTLEATHVMTLWSEMTAHQFHFAAAIHGVPATHRLMVVAFAVACLGSIGLWPGWNSRRWLKRGWLAASPVAFIVMFISIFRQMQWNAERIEAMCALGSLRAAADQFYFETGTTTVKYDELVGPNCYVKTLHPLPGVDLHALFPHQQGTPWLVTLPDGRKVGYD